MKKLAFLFTLSLLFIYGCSTEEVMTTDSSNENLNEELTRGPIMHHVNVGGNDACEAWGLPPGCDENFSLSARMHADGSVNGQWQDTFAGDDEGIHVAVDCLIVDGNTAVIGGYITEGMSGGVDVTGLYVVTAVKDNGTSNNDPADQISYSWIDITTDCYEFPFDAFPLFDTPRGQVKVR